MALCIFNLEKELLCFFILKAAIAMQLICMPRICFYQLLLA